MFTKLLPAALSAAVAVALIPLSVAAATLQESSILGGDFSGDWKSPTVIGAGPASISGTWASGRDHDFLSFTGLKPGAQQVTLTFRPLGTPTDNGFSAGGYVKFSFEQPRTSGEDNTRLGSVQFGLWNAATPNVMTLDLGQSFSGPLYLSLFSTHGNASTGLLSYNIFAAGNGGVATTAPATGPVVSAVPLPSAMLMLLAGLAGLAGIAWRRRAI